LALNTVRTNALILIVLLFVQLLLMSGSAKGSHGSSSLESRMMFLSSPVVGVAHSIAGGVKRSLEGVRSMLAAHLRSAALLAEVEQLRAEVAMHREAALENRRLRRMLSMRDYLAPDSIGASVVTSIQTGPTRMLVLDRGASSGVEPDLPVVAWGGAVGRVVSVERDKSKVLLLSDPNGGGAAGIVQRTRAGGMVVGQGEELLALRYVPGFADVESGDRVVTSGLDGIFPRGFGIGTVVSTRESSDGSRVIRLRPAVEYRSLEEVLILLEPIGGDLLSPSWLGDAP
jgi:rod shape-determining protein MreC